MIEQYLPRLFQAYETWRNKQGEILMMKKII